ncbi:MAG: polymer-forming cytoskeletal protein [bacterium]|nr:polymer-forming cytoskeletal protein [bacterium]
MLGRNNTKNTTGDATSVNLIGNGTTIIGDITSGGDVRIDGLLKGNIVITGKFVLGASGSVEGNITSVNADLSGEVRGTVSIAEVLSLKSTAKIAGDIITSKLVIEPGALFTGTCNMGAKVKNMVQNSGHVNVAAQTA